MKIHEVGDSVVWDFNPVQDRPAKMGSKIAMLAKYAARRERPIVFLCIGTDIVVGDALGPLVGTKLTEMFHSDFQVYGTLASPVDATNVQQTVEDIEQEFENPFLIAVDAAFNSSAERKGLITFSIGGIEPGSATKKDLPEVGNLAIRGIVAGGSNASLLGSKIRLADVMMQADFIAKGLYRAYNSVLSQTSQSSVAV